MPLKKLWRNLWLAALVCLSPASLRAAAHAITWDDAGAIHGQYDKNKGDEFWQSAVDDQKGWQYVWSTLEGAVGAKTPPSIDFKRDAVVAAMSPPKPTTGWTMQMAKRADTRDPEHLVVFYWDEPPALGVICENKSTSPFVLMKIKRHASVEFIYGKPTDLAVLKPGSDHPIKPDAEVHADKGSIRVTLRVLKSKIKPDETIWYQLSVKNIGKEKIVIRDPIFWDPDPRSKKERHAGLQYVGRSPGPTGDDPGCLIDCGTAPPAMSQAQHEQLDAARAQWQKEGASDEAIANKTNDFINKAVETNSPESPKAKGVEPYARLLPGGEITTFGWAYNEHDDAPVLKPLRAPVGDYMEGYGKFSPGKYVLKGFYDYGDRAQFRGASAAKPLPWNVTLKTPAITIEVLP